MQFTSPLSSLARLLAASTLCMGLGQAHAAVSKAVDAAGKIETFDILGVKLGMTQAQAIAAIKERFPAGTKDSRGRVVNLKMTDYTLPNPVTRAPMRAGVRFDMIPEQRGNYDFVKILFNNDKVWAVWRDDTTASYAYEKTMPDMGAKYGGAVQVTDYWDILVNGNRQNDGTRIPVGYELYQGSCSDDRLPFQRSSQSDVLRLDGNCKKFFRVNYGVLQTAGVKTMSNGTAQLVDLDAGRAFLASGEGIAARDAAKAAATGAKF